MNTSSQGGGPTRLVPRTVFQNLFHPNNLGSGCGSVGRAVASNSRCPWFKSSHRQKFIEHLSTVNCIEKTKIKEKVAGNGPFKIKNNLGAAIAQGICKTGFESQAHHLSFINYSQICAILSCENNKNKQKEAVQNNWGLGKVKVLNADRITRFIRKYHSCLILKALIN